MKVTVMALGSALHFCSENKCLFNFVCVDKIGQYRIDDSMTAAKDGGRGYNPT